MSRELLHRIIDMAFARAGHSDGQALSVSFAVGGEPTHNWSLFSEAVSEFRRRECEDPDVKKVFLSMTTNGYYGTTKRRFVTEHFDHITLSLDGTPAIQNLHRPTRGSKDSYGKVADSLRHFLRARSRLRVGVRATVSDRSVHLLPSIVEFLASEFGGGYAVAFEPLVQLGRARHCDKVNSPSVEDFFSAFVNARRVGHYRDIRVTTSGPSVNRLVAQYCGAMALPSFAVCYDGSVTACHRDCRGEDYGYGTLLADSGRFVEEPDRVLENSAFARIPEECDDCFVKWNCAGDCPDLRKHGWNRCALNKALAFADLNLALTHEGGKHANYQ